MKPRGLVVLWLAFWALLPCVGMAQVRGVSDKEILLGSYSDLSGIGASWGSASVNAMRLRFDECERRHTRAPPPQQVHGGRWVRVTDQL